VGTAWPPAEGAGGRAAGRGRRENALCITYPSQANAFCERLLGTLRRECVDYLIPLSENHLCRILQAWVPHYNAGRPHSSLGPGIPQPPSHLPVTLRVHRHQLPQHLKVVAQPILGGLHHEYGLAEKVA
jgi:putative transposase